MDINETVIPLVVALIGAVSGLMPIVITAIFRWSEQRSQRTTEKLAIESAQRRLEFVNLWIQTQQLLCSDEDFAAISKDVGDEMKALRNVIQSYSPLGKQITITAEDKSLEEPCQKKSRWQIAVLGYWPEGAVCWIFHLLFYMAIGACLLLTCLALYLVLFYDQQDVFYEDFLVIPVISVLAYLLFWLPARLIAKNRYKECMQTSVSRN